MKYGIKNEKRLELPCLSVEFDKVDMCQPDMALTPQEIIERFTVGLPVPNLERNGYYDGDKYNYDDKLPEDYDDISDVHDEFAKFNDRMLQLQQERDESKQREIDELRQKAVELDKLRSGSMSEQSELENPQ